ncbi:MAG TPA: cytochrome c biogenesis protein DipZ [Baekduia sp.]|uniref:cytochrome c biogenesis protein DipZ n=1 Tax=Baekduia sp. TaxID=2600305 RepID=UPI002CD76341|nr:cytochrome c biogenesis protein DipZ [Baekduia sp.]HMJ32952.1 cytochrome c biogenesis protein DipZ [Baekduia sp.]
MLILLVLSAVVGAGTALSPCALPVLPALLSAGAAGGRRRPLGVVIGLSATFAVSIVGGGELLRHLGLGDTTLRHVGIAVLLVAGVAALAPPLAVRLERPLAGLSRLGPRRLGDGFGSGLVVGGALGFVYAPCAGPVLAAVVSISAATGRTVAIAIAYVAGSAAVLLVIALGGRRVMEPLRRAGALRVQRVLGAVMIITAIVFAANLDLRFETALARHTSALTLTGGIERSHAVQDRLDRLRGRPRFDAAAHAAPAHPHAKLPDLGAAPDFTGTQRWFNTPGGRPLSLKALRGRVVLIDFWTYTCINCLRTLPYLEAWDRRYRDEGLTIVGVHAPEFGFEHDAGNVARAISTNGIDYPVVQDNDLATWNAWGNQYWPAEYLIDATGHVRHTHFGEGRYAESEAAIRALLAERGATVGVAPAKPRDVTPVSAATTPETYVGAARAQGFVGTPPAKGTRTYRAPAGAPPLHAFALGGTWAIGDEAATAVSHATLTASVQARFVYLVLSPPAGGRRGRVDVTVDGRRSRTVTVDRQRLYTLAELPRNGRHRLDLALAPGTSAYAFTFG